MTTKFEEALVKAALIEGDSAIRYENSKNGTKFPYYYGVEVGFRRGAQFAQSFYLPLLIEAMASLEFYADESNWDEIWIDGPTEESSGDCSCKIDREDIEVKVDSEGNCYYATAGNTARTKLASLRQKLGEEK